MGLAHAGPKQAEVILNLGTWHGGAGCANPVDRWRWRREPLDAVAVGFLHLTDELPCVGGERFHVLTLSLSIQRVEAKEIFRARNAAHDDEAAAWEAYVNVLQVMRPCPTDLNPSGIADWTWSSSDSWSTVLESLPVAQVTKGTGASKRTGSSDSGWRNSKAKACRATRPSGSAVAPCKASPTMGQPNFRIAIRIGDGVRFR